MKNINIGILGCGTVGSGVAKILTQNKEIIESRLDAGLNLKLIADINADAVQKDTKLEPSIFTEDAFKVTDDPDIDIIVETIGGEKVAKELMLRAISNKKHIVTANKALIANKGEEIFEAALKNGVDIAFEASVGGCIPIIKTIRESLAGDDIESMIGILNGTSNYILTKMAEEKTSFKDALSAAQEKGFAEADPTLDIEGFDAAHKIAIIASIAYGSKVSMEDIFIEGISGITPIDINFAERLGYKIKLLAIAKRNNGKIEIRVHPAMIPCDDLLSNVRGSVNGINISGKAVGDIVMKGKGAGQMPTAAAVVGDIVDISRNIICKASRRIYPFSYKNIKESNILPFDEISTNYYFRFSVSDKPGVLSKISGILGDHGISIISVQQNGRDKPVTLVMLTHIAKEAKVQKALDQISSLDIIEGKPVLIRIEEPPLYTI